MLPDCTDYWDDYPCHACDECEQYVKRLDHAKDFFEGILNMLSKKQPYNGALLENYLEELGSALRVDFDMNEINLTEVKI